MTASPFAAMVARQLGAIPERHRYVTVSASAQEELGRAYLALPTSAPGTPARQAWNALACEVWQQYGHLRAHGLHVIVQDSDPYASAADMMRDVQDNRTIRVLSTRSTGGHPYWCDEDNDAFRAVHDVLGHAATGRGFDRHGEEAAYRCHASTFSPLARMALATETRGQNSAMILNGGVFPDQRIAILPIAWRGTDSLAPRTDAERTDAAFHAMQCAIDAGLTL